MRRASEGDEHLPPCRDVELRGRVWAASSLQLSLNGVEGHNVDGVYLLLLLLLLQYVLQRLRQAALAACGGTD